MSTIRILVFPRLSYVELHPFSRWQAAKTMIPFRNISRVLLFLPQPRQ